MDLIKALVFEVEGYNIRGFINAHLCSIASFFPCHVFDLLHQDQSLKVQDFAIQKPWDLHQDQSTEVQDFAVRQQWLFNHAEKLGAERICWALLNAPSCLPDGKAGQQWFGRLSQEDQRIVVDHFLLSCKGSYGAFLFAYAPMSLAWESAYSCWRTANRNTDGVIVTSALNDLPWDLREAEACYHIFKLPCIQSRSGLHLWVTYTCLLPWEEAEAVLDPI
jgi:hypothetical protein